MTRSKLITINGHQFQMEQRICANYGCEKLFWVNLESDQSICGKNCWEYVNHRMWRRGSVQPKIRRPGDRKRPKAKTKVKENRMRATVDDSWRLHEARKKAESKGSSVHPILPRVAKAR